MTVESIDANGAVNCVWFQNGKGQLSSRSFVAKALEVVPLKAVRIHRPDGSIGGRRANAD